MATWYWQGFEFDAWAANLFTDDYAGIGSSPPEIPWTGVTTKDDDIDIGEMGNGYSSITSTIGDPTGNWTITGICSIDLIQVNGSIYDGTFVGDSLENYLDIYGGTFTGSGFLNDNGNIYSGTFTGSNFTNEYGTIYGVLFSGSNFYNREGFIYGGLFTGSGFTNYWGYIYSGTFTGSNFTNSENDTYDSYIYGGTFTGSNFTNGGILYSGFWWLKGSSKINGVNLRASGDASPDVKFITLETSDILGSGLI